MSKIATKNMLSRINELIGVKESEYASIKLFEVFESEEETKDLFDRCLLEFKGQLHYDWFHEYFQEELADRDKNKQDFTPMRLSELMSEVLTKDGVMYEPSAGTGSMVINNWNKQRKGVAPWNFDNLKNFYIVEELSKRTVAFLIFNLAIRGVNANVIHINSITRECFDVWHLENLETGFNYSKIIKLPKNEILEKIFKFKFA